MISAKLIDRGSRGMAKAAKEYQTVKKQQHRGFARAARAGRTLAAKDIRRISGLTSRHIKARLKATKGGLKALRLPVPVEQLGAREDRETDIVTVRRWPTASGARSESFQPARRGWRGNPTAFYALIRGRWRRLKGQSVARVWVGLRKPVQERMRAVYRNHMDTWIAGVRRRAGART